MIANLHQSTASVFYSVRDQKVIKASTYKQRVVADRIAMAMMLVATIILAAITA